MLNSGPGFVIYARREHCTQMPTAAQSFGRCWCFFCLPFACISWHMIFLGRKTTTKKTQIMRVLESKCCICRDEYFPAELVPEVIFIQLTKQNKLLLGLSDLPSQSTCLLLPQLSLQEVGSMSPFPDISHTKWEITSQGSQPQGWHPPPSMPSSTAGQSQSARSQNETCFQKIKWVLLNAIQMGFKIFQGLSQGTAPPHFQNKVRLRKSLVLQKQGKQTSEWRTHPWNKSSLRVIQLSPSTTACYFDRQIPWKRGGTEPPPIPPLPSQGGFTFQNITKPKKCRAAGSCHSCPSSSCYYCKVSGESQKRQKISSQWPVTL